MTSGELARSAWVGGAKVVETAGCRVVRLVRRVPMILKLACRQCGATWTAVTNKKGNCPRGWRRCPSGCNASKNRSHR